MKSHVIVASLWTLFLPPKKVFKSGPLNKTSARIKATREGREAYDTPSPARIVLGVTEYFTHALHTENIPVFPTNHQ